MLRMIGIYVTWGLCICTLGKYYGLEHVYPDDHLTVMIDNVWNPPIEQN